MCWSSKNAILMRAKEPIPVFKILFKNMESIYQHFKYNLHIEYLQKLESPYITGFGFHIFEGIHSYDAETSFIKDHPIDPNFFVITNKEGYYLDTFSKSSYGTKNAYIQVMGIIPKGAEYYRNELGEIVSNSIILIEIKQI